MRSPESSRKLDSNLSDPSSLMQIEDPGNDFVRRVRHAASTVLAGSDAGREVLALCDDTLQARQRVLRDRTSHATVIAIVGAAGQGKSWVARQLVHDPDIRSAIPSGNSKDQATEQMIWIGPIPPSGIDSRYERYIHCDASDLEDLGGDYILVDTPGATDDDRSIAETARQALSLAVVLIMVIRRDQLRSQTASALASLSEGTLVVPIINAIRDTESDELRTDVDAILATIRSAAPAGMVLAPLLVPDFDTHDESEDAIGRLVGGHLSTVLKPYLNGRLNDERRKRIRVDSIETRFRESLQLVLKSHLPDLTRAVKVLNSEAERLPRDVARSLVGRSETLRAGIRSRLRLALITNTAAIWFPYRSILGLLNLTHGAWDRVVLSLSGSLPSLITAAWASTRNWQRAGEAEQDIREGLRRRSNAAVTERLGPTIARFHEQLNRLGDRNSALSSLAQNNKELAMPIVHLVGIDALQEESQRIFDEEIDQRTSSIWLAGLLGFMGTFLFWSLMVGPIVALYREYVTASYATLVQGSGLEHFPKPQAIMLLTSVLLSTMPTALFSMLVLTWAQRTRSVRLIEKRIRDRHHETITRLQEERVLGLQWNDPQLADAEFLLSVGRKQ